MRVSLAMRREIVAYLSALDRRPPFPIDSPEMRADDGDGIAMLDLRLQVHRGRWAILTGDPSYDQDHRGRWGSTVVPFDGDPDREYIAADVADDLIDQVEDADDDDDDDDGRPTGRGNDETAHYRAGN